MEVTTLYLKEIYLLKLLDLYGIHVMYVICYMCGMCYICYIIDVTFVLYMFLICSESDGGCPVLEPIPLARSAKQLPLRLMICPS